MSAALESTAGIVARLRAARVVPVLVIESAEDAGPLAAALSAGGLPVAEVTFRTAAAAEALRRMGAEAPHMLAGAGTVLTRDQARAAVDAGAKFIVSPGFGRQVVDWCLEHAVPVFPGVCTPTEIQLALERGLSTLKFFPAENAGGVAYLKALAGPFGGVEFIPTGGINATNVVSYLALRNVVACGGSWMAPADWVREKQFDRIREETARAVEAAGGSR